MKLLTRANAKIIKGERRGYVTYILHLAPAKLSGYEVCGGRSPECTKYCLNLSGRGKFAATQQARVRKTKWFFEHRASFMAQLVKDISTAIKYGMRNGLKVVIRLNGTSDIPWESIQCGCFTNIMERFPFTQFYDYTKILGRKNIPENYHLTFSLSETNHDIAKQAMEQGMNLAVVFDHIPLIWQGKPVISGEDDDLRFLDPPGHIIGLRAKGDLVNSQSIFMQRTSYESRTNRSTISVNGRRHSQSGKARTYRRFNNKTNSKRNHTQLAE